MEIAKLSKLITPSGTMAISNKARVLREQGKPVIGFGAGEPDFPTPEYVIKDVQVAAEDTSNHKYSPVAGLTILKEEIVRTSELYSGININQENVLVSNGGKHAILTTFMSILNPGDEVLIPSPYWTTYPEAVKISGGNPVIVDTEFGDDFKINTDQLDALKTSRTKVLVWVSPSNPTGVVYTKEEAEKIYTWAFENNVWILSDELYEHLVYEGKTSPSPAQYDTGLKNTIVINGVAKAYSMTGWRVGWIIANTEVIDMAKKIQSHATSNVSNISQIAAYSALKNGLDQTELMKESFNRRRLHAIEEFSNIENINLIKSTGAFYLFPDVSYYSSSGVISGVHNSIDFCNWLLDEYFIAFVPGEVFGKNGFLRCSYALSDDDLHEGLSRFSKAINDLK
ncbi:pyridoxal phosphate-dependent aminotransferase [Acidimicrobiia bacterium]|jgi:aspartate aminotransferase|nr:pyridoxal phosphate-dependent aminotransferase [Acidimicrobiaceae bacterium]MDA8667389.1 pyridoxal phosphate-dependent aminotransferase [Candidatus Actinomarina sp.]MDA8964131.1 pyridoxal phosphate-dependent aminotransferase [Acidimicrobiia bacterium]MDA7850929.1 pyridoxal phosphate-dependent aminotransferase [Acidimicrobiaceae bacterium]MDA8719339.1 pyridoxal phosphate-dependent aminotransferase [Candidatus Actinomarina sp.]|tara:strand:+ start:16390 stop:17580 length:1191 start_codon:yes stop_codon:yes gene_type:complete